MFIPDSLAEKYPSMTLAEAKALTRQSAADQSDPKTRLNLAVPVDGSGRRVGAPVHLNHVSILPVPEVDREVRCTSEQMIEALSGAGWLNVREIIERTTPRNKISARAVLHHLEREGKVLRSGTARGTRYKLASDVGGFEATNLCGNSEPDEETP